MTQFEVGQRVTYFQCKPGSRAWQGLKHHGIVIKILKDRIRIKFDNGKLSCVNRDSVDRYRE